MRHTIVLMIVATFLLQGCAQEQPAGSPRMNYGPPSQFGGKPDTGTSGFKGSSSFGPSDSGFRPSNSGFKGM